MQRLHVHPDNPQRRLVKQAVDSLRRGDVIVYPTDSSYALGCTMGNKSAMERICRLRHIDKDHNFTLVCRDLSEIANYARLGNQEFRLLKRLTPGPYTFILDATREVPRRLQNPRRKTIGLRVPAHPVAQCLLELLGEPLMSVTLILGEDVLPLSDPDDIAERVGRQVDLFVDSGSCGHEPTSVIDLTGDLPVVVRHGQGDLAFLED